MNVCDLPNCAAPRRAAGFDAITFHDFFKAYRDGSYIKRSSSMRAYGLAGTHGLGWQPQKRRLGILRQLPDRVFGARRGGTVDVGTRTEQTNWWIGARVTRAAAGGVLGITALQIVGDAGIERTVAAFDQIEVPAGIHATSIRKRRGLGARVARVPGPIFVFDAPSPTGCEEQAKHRLATSGIIDIFCAILADLAACYAYPNPPPPTGAL